MPPLPPRLALAACLGVAVALLVAAAQALHVRLHRRTGRPIQGRPPALSARRQAALLSCSSVTRRRLPSDPHTAALPNTRDLAAFLPGIKPGRLYRTASPLEGGGGRAAALAGVLNDVFDGRDGGVGIGHVVSRQRAR